MSSGRRPVSTFTTPPGTSDVANTSVSVTAGSGRVSDARTTTVLPATSGGASRETRPRSDDVSGATMPTTPVGSGIVKLKYGAATGFEDPSTWPILSAQPAYQTQRSIAASTTRAAAGSRRPSAAPTSATNWSRRPSMSSATRYSTWPRFMAVLSAQPGNALRAARTASRRSFREARLAFASVVPSAADTTYERPDSERGNAPPTYSL